MGTGALTARTDGETIPASDHNELTGALSVDLVPRNSSRISEDIAGQLGTSTLRWLRAYVKEYRVGIVTDDLKIYSPIAGEVWVERNATEVIKIKENLIEFIVSGSTVFSLTPTGIDWAVQPALSIPTTRIAAKGFSEDITTGTTVYASGTDAVDTVLTTISGKRYLVVGLMKEIGGLSSGLGFTGSTMNFRVNGSLVKNVGSYTPLNDGDPGIFPYTSFSYIYLATSNGAKTFGIEITNGYVKDISIQVTEL